MVEQGLIDLWDVSELHGGETGRGRTTPDGMRRRSVERNDRDKRRERSSGQQ
jgi:hypothetical protein